ncbi:MAG: slipin family protein [Deltaproteobacteria bacterium]|nr:slipin family protein [Deltaproteobacteria bacterium]
MGFTPIAIAVFLLLALLFSSVRVLAEWERGVLFRLGRFQSVKGAGIRIVIPGIDQLIKVSLREVVMDVPPQDVITRDNVSVKVNAVLYFRVVHPDHAIIKVENFMYGTSQLAQTTLRSVCGQCELDHLLADRERINHQLQTELDRGTDPWGVKVRAVEIKHIDLPQEMQRAMAKQAEAERERRAKVIHAEGEFEASQRLREASDVMVQSPYTLQLRYLQTLSEIAVEHNSTILFPMPMDLLAPLVDAARNKAKS